MKKILKILRSLFITKSKKYYLDHNILLSATSTCDDTVLKSNTSVGNYCYLYKTIVGSYTYLAGFNSVMNTEIGKFCSIAEGVKICLGKHPSSTFVSTSPTFYSPRKKFGKTFSDKEYFSEMGSVKIGNDVWIGVNAVILDDVKIGHGAIIGAGSVVTKDIPDFAIAVGIPAHVIRYRFSSDQIDFLLKFKWWDKEESWLQQNFKDLHDIQLFMAKHT